MLILNRIHHIALICADYEKSKSFYTTILGLTIIKETFRAERKSFKLDLALNGNYVLELFSFPDPPSRISKPEAVGLRHLAFEVNDIEEAIAYLNAVNVPTEALRVDEITGKKSLLSEKFFEKKVVKKGPIGPFSLLFCSCNRKNNNEQK